MQNNIPRVQPLEVLYPRSLKYLSDYLQSLIRGRLWLQVMVGMVLGITVGVVMGPSVGWVEPLTAATLSDWLAFPGKLFLALIQMIVIPLVFASIIRGLAATEDMEQLRRMGLRVVLYFIATTALAIIIGLTVASLIKPGTYVDSQALQATLGAVPTIPETTTPSTINIKELPHKVITLLPTNPLSSMVESNMLQVVVFAMVVGTVGIPAAGIALIMGVDRILDMSRTAVNVSGDLVAAKLMDCWVGGKASLSEQLSGEVARERIRAQTGEDVITETPPGVSQ